MNYHNLQLTLNNVKKIVRHVHYFQEEILLKYIDYIEKSYTEHSFQYICLLFGIYSGIACSIYTSLMIGFDNKWSIFTGFMKELTIFQFIIFFITTFLIGFITSTINILCFTMVKQVRNPKDIILKVRNNRYDNYVNSLYIPVEYNVTAEQINQNDNQNNENIPVTDDVHEHNE